MKRLFAALAAMVLLCGSVYCNSAAMAAQSEGVTLESNGFDIRQNYYLPQKGEIVQLSEMECSFYDIVPDFSEYYNSSGENLEYYGAHDGYLFFGVRNTAASKLEILKVSCTTAEVSLYLTLFNSDAQIDYVDNDYIVYSIWTYSTPTYGSNHYNWTTYIYTDGVKKAFRYPVNEAGGVIRVSSTFYYDGQLTVTFDNYPGEYTLPVIYGYNVVKGENTVFRFNASDVHYGAGQLTYKHYLSPDNMYSSRCNYVDYTHYNDGAYAGYTYRIKEDTKNLFGDSYELGYYVGGTSMQPLVISKNGAKPYDLHITKHGIAAWNTSTVLSDNACPILMNIYGKQMTALDFVPHGSTIECDNEWLYFVKCTNNGNAWHRSLSYHIVSVRSMDAALALS